MNCPICGEKNWENIDELRSKPAGMIICTSCGFISYERAQDEAALKEHYEKEYRIGGVQAGNIITCNRKLHFNAVFLEPLWKKWAQEERKTRVLDIGCAIGYLLQLAKIIMPKCEVYGTEWTEAMRRVAYHLYNIDVTEEINKEIKYRFISSYHVHEHVPQPDKKLLEYRELLEDDGFLYISIPIWFEEFDNWDGIPMNSFDHHYHPDHINTWQKEHFDYMMSKAGYELERDNDTIYGYTGLYKKGEVKAQLKKLDYKEIIEKLKKQRDAIIAFNTKRFDDAIALEPKYIDAYIHKVMLISANMKGGDIYAEQMETIEKAISIAPKNGKLIHTRALINYQWNKFEKAEHDIKLGLQLKPLNESFLQLAAQLEIARGQHHNAVAPLNKIMEINPSRYNEIMTNILACFSKMPTKREQKLMAEIKEATDKIIQGKK